MTELRYRRVTRRRPCLICGKPDWCSTTPDDRISFCARANLGADRVSKEGWGVFYQNNVLTSRSNRYQKPAARKPLHLAPIEVRDFVYRKLIEFSPAPTSREILGSPVGLYSRKIFDATDYGNLPRKAAERNKMASRLLRLLDTKFPSFADDQKCLTQGIPGFWSDNSGRARLWSEYDFVSALLLIPVSDRKGLIQACLLRPIGEIPDGSSRYFWLSSAGKRGGSSPGSPLHYAESSISMSRPVLVTEGPLKAQTAKAFLPDYDIVASSGVSCSHTEIVSAARYRPVEIAFDTDSFENPHVAGALARLLCLRLTDQEIHRYDKELSVLTWDRGAKGLDEALIKGLPINALTPSEWYAQLPPECQSAVSSGLAQIPFAHRNCPQSAKQTSGGQRTKTNQSKHLRYDRLRAVIA